LARPLYAQLARAYSFILFVGSRVHLSFCILHNCIGERSHEVDSSNSESISALLAQLGPQYADAHDWRVMSAIAPADQTSSALGEQLNSNESSGVQVRSFQFSMQECNETMGA